MRLDFSEIKETKNCETGIQDLTIVSAEEKTSKNGVNMLVLVLKNEEDESVVTDNICLEGKGAFKAQQLCKALGITTDDLSAMQAAELKGLVVNVEVIHEEYEGVDRAKIKKYFAA